MLSFLLRCAAFLELAAVVAFFEVTSLLEDDDEGWVSLNTPTIYKQTQSFLMVYGIFANKKKAQKVEKRKDMSQTFQSPVSISVVRELFLIVFTRNSHWLV